MREFVARFIAKAARIAVFLGVLALSAGCSAEITRLSQPFFSDFEVTGSVPPIPQENVAAPAASAAPAATAAATALTTGVNAPTAVSLSAAAGGDIPRAAGDGFFMIRAGAGETAYSLSRRYGVSVRAIMAANRLARPEDVRPGQNILIPPIAWRPDSQITSGIVEQPAREARPVHIVRGGETLSGIARQYGLSASDLARRNRLASADRLHVGQRLELPPAAPVRVAEASTFADDGGGPAPTALPPRQVEPQARLASLEPLPPSVGQGEALPLPPPRPSPQQMAVAAPQKPKPRQASRQALPEPQAMSVGKFRWPVRGRVIAQFGSRPNGAQNDGINIAVPEGTSVKAAESGVVAYVGNELKGYGNLILIRHADDWVSAYAHNSQTLVARGEQVRRGQVIAKAGQSGSVTQPQLHFELRKGSRPVDPIRYLDGTG